MSEPSDVVVGLSGGLDSSLAAALLKHAGWDVHGLHFLMPASPSRVDVRLKRVREIAERLNIPLHIMDLREIFSEDIINPFIDSYLGGLTPNPCVVCNQLIKFKYLLCYAKENDLHWISTGHYVRLRKRLKPSVTELLRGRDRRKEQSYFLHRLDQRYLATAIFPLGEMTKDEARNKARKIGLPLLSIPESHDICFLPENDYRLFINEKRGAEINRPGNIIDVYGKIAGKHAGAFRYTIGQRHGLGIASSLPYYVKEVRPETNEVIVGRRNELYSDVVEAEDFNWVDGIIPERHTGLHAQIRYRHKPGAGSLEILSPHKVRFKFDEPEWAVAPGQALVCYEGERVIGGGWITKDVNVHEFKGGR